MSAFEDRLWSQLVGEHGERMRAAPRAAAALAESTVRQPSRTGPWRSVAMGGGLATAAGVVIVALSLAGGASSAFAGWSAIPNAPTAAQLAVAQAKCAAEAAVAPTLPLRLTDARGPFTFIVYADDQSDHTCITGPSFTNSSGWGSSSPIRVPASGIYLSSEHTTTDGGQAYGFVVARAGDEVSAATLTLEDGAEVTATVQNGWAVAWWPGSHQVTRAQLTTSSGTQTQTFPLSPCGHPLDRCTGGGGPHGGAPSGGPGGG